MQTRTSKKQIHELEEVTRETIDASARLYARYEYDATGKAYAYIHGERISYKSNSELFFAVLEMIDAETEAREATEPKPIQTVAGHPIFATCIDSTTGENVFTVDDLATGPRFWYIAEARHYCQCNPKPEQDAETAAALAAFEDSRPTAEDIRTKYDSPYLIWEDDPETDTPENYATEDAAYSLINAYADAIGEYPAETDPEYMAAFAVAGEEIAGWHGVADIHDRATVAAMVEAIADAARFMRPFAIASATADRLCEAYDATTGNLTAAAYDAAQVVARADIAGCHATDTDYAWVSQMVEAIAAEPAQNADSAPLYQRYELLAYLGDPDAYDIEAIEAEATTYTADGVRVWSAFGEDLAAIAERHELYTYAPAI